jgi:hypothetical protein
MSQFARVVKGAGGVAARGDWAGCGRRTLMNTGGAKACSEIALRSHWLETDTGGGGPGVITPIDDQRHEFHERREAIQSSSRAPRAQRHEAIR